MLKLIFCWILLGCITTFVWAQDLSTPTHNNKTPPAETASQSSPSSWTSTIIFNLGTHTEFYNNVQTDSSGGMRKIDLEAPTIGLGLAHSLTPSWTFLPEINWVLPRHSGSSKVIKNLFMYRADFGYDLFEWLRLRIGSSLMHSNIHGRGGKATLNNGNETSTFYYPDENRSSLNNTLDLGLETRYENFSFRLQTYIYSIFIEEKRQVSYTLLLSYYWDR